MANRGVRHVYAKELLSDLRDSFFVQLIGVVVAVAGGLGLFALFDVSGGHSWVFGVGIAILWEGFVIYSVVSRTADRLEEVAGAGSDCRILSGPTHARLRQRATGWRSDAVSLYLAATPGAAVDAKLVFPSELTLTWVNSQSHPFLWTLVGVNESGSTTYDVRVPHVKDFITSLGQFSVGSAQQVATPPQIKITATENFDGKLSSTELVVGAMFDVPDEDLE